MTLEQDIAHALDMYAEAVLHGTATNSESAPAAFDPKEHAVPTWTRHPSGYRVAGIAAVCGLLVLTTIAVIQLTTNPRHSSSAAASSAPPRERQLNGVLLAIPGEWQFVESALGSRGPSTPLGSTTNATRLSQPTCTQTESGSHSESVCANTLTDLLPGEIVVKFFSNHATGSFVADGDFTVAGLPTHVSRNEVTSVCPFGSTSQEEVLVDTSSLTNPARQLEIDACFSEDSGVAQTQFRALLEAAHL